MNFDLTVLKERALEAFAKISQVLIFQLACLYLLACLVTAKPVSPKNYVTFVYYCFQFQLNGQHGTPANSAKK